MELFFLMTCAAIAIHRIWNYERIFETPRNYIKTFVPSWLGYVFTCAACNALWIALLVVVLATLPFVSGKIILTGFAIYPFIRLTMWGVDFVHSLSRAPEERVFTQPQKNNTTIKTNEETHKKCSTCEQSKIDAVEENKRVSAFKKRIVIMTALSNFHASYSLSTCVIEQARSLALARKDWLVQVWVMQITNDSLWPKDMPINVELRKVVPQIGWSDDKYDAKAAGLLAATLGRELVALGNASIITHDILFQRSYLTFAAAIHSLSKLKGLYWWHQAHSGPSSLQSRPELPLLYRYSLPQEHRFLSINETHNQEFEKHYAIESAAIDTCPNIRDLRTVLGCSTEISDFITKTKLAEADIVQVYPVSTSRMHHKGIRHIIKIFGALKHTGKQVRLVVVNAHANNNETLINEVKSVATSWNLHDEDLIFTSDHFKNRLSEGLSAQDTQQLMQFGNVFIFPTIAEASSLVLAEAALAGALVVANANVPSVRYDLPDALSYSFGTLDDTHWPSSCASPAAIAEDVCRYLGQFSANITKRHILKHRNYDVLGMRLADILEART